MAVFPALFAVSLVCVAAWRHQIPKAASVAVASDRAGRVDLVRSNGSALLEKARSTDRRNGSQPARHLLSAAPAEFDDSEVRLYLEYARAALCKKHAVESWDCGTACDGPAQVLPGTVRNIRGRTWRAHGYVARVPTDAGSTACIAAFRGSDDSENWIANFQWDKTQWPSWCATCKVHTGFYKVYAEIRTEVFRAVSDLKCHSLALAGHSLGGALAQLASLDFRHEMPESLERVGPVWTFGMPRVGNVEFAARYTEEAVWRGESPPLWRVVHHHDPVPHLPPAKLKYRHPPLEAYIFERNGNSSSVRVCPSKPDGAENDSCSWYTGVLEKFSNDHNLYFGMIMEKEKMEAKCIQA